MSKIEIPSVFKSNFEEFSPLFLLYSEKVRDWVSNLKSLIISLFITVYCLHLSFVVVFENHFLTLFSIENLFSFGKITPFSIEKYCPLIPLFIIMAAFSFGGFVSFRELFFPTKTHWIGTTEGLFVITNNTKVQKIIWQDFFGKIKFCQNVNLQHISLYYYNNKLERYHKIIKEIEFFKEQHTIVSKFKKYFFVFNECSIYAATGTQDTESIIRKLIIEHSVD